MATEARQVEAGWEEVERAVAQQVEVAMAREQMAKAVAVVSAAETVEETQAAAETAAAEVEVLVTDEEGIEAEPWEEAPEEVPVEAAPTHT